MRPRLIADFENGAVALADFHHREHLQVALWFALEYAAPEALDRMHSGLQELLAGSGRQDAYSEATTVRWMERIQVYLRTADRMQSLEQMAADLMAPTKTG